jgi:hypothetical protein
MGIVRDELLEYVRGIIQKCDTIGALGAFKWGFLGWYSMMTTSLLG